MSSLSTGVCHSDICTRQRNMIKSLDAGAKEQVKRTLNFCKECKSYHSPARGRYCPCCKFRLRWTKHTRKDPKVYY